MELLPYISTYFSARRIYKVCFPRKIQRTTPEGKFLQYYLSIGLWTEPSSVMYYKIQPYDDFKFSGSLSSKPKTLPDFLGHHTEIFYYNFGELKPMKCCRHRILNISKHCPIALIIFIFSICCILDQLKKIHDDYYISK
jgi:hypothetical protein